MVMSTSTSPLFINFFFFLRARRILSLDHIGREKAGGYRCRIIMRWFYQLQVASTDANYTLEENRTQAVFASFSRCFDPRKCHVSRYIIPSRNADGAGRTRAEPMKCYI
jgi:hypothetical protein